jgi:hypothetical protein
MVSMQRGMITEATEGSDELRRSCVEALLSFECGRDKLHSLAVDEPKRASLKSFVANLKL